MSRNIIEKTNLALAVKHSMTDGLSSYTQANCQCSITSEGYYKVYRPANLTYSGSDSSTRTMWGGLCLYPFSIDTNALVDNHSYIIKCLIKGKSSNGIVGGADGLWSNNIGWGGGGLMPAPTNVVTNRTTDFGNNFNYPDWHLFYYAFTVSDGVHKVCTSSYANYVAGETYLSYKGFKIGWGYSSTGEMGTEIYIKDLQLIDVTSKPKADMIKKNRYSESIYID